MRKICNGVFKVKGNSGTEYGFDFGTYSMSVTTKSLGKSVTRFLADMFDHTEIERDGKKERVIAPNENSDNHMIHYFYGGAVAFAELNEIEDKITPVKVSKWLEDIGESEMFRIWTESMKSPNAVTSEATSEVKEAKLNKL